MLDNLNLPMAELDALSVPDLRTIQDQLAAADAKLKAQKAIFEAVMERRFGQKAQEAYTTAKKDTGTVNIAATNTLTLKIETDKKVEWDQDGTMAWLNKQTKENAQHYGKLKVEVPEAIYKAAPPATKSELSKLRTVKAGKRKFTFVNVEIPEAVAA